MISSHLVNICVWPNEAVDSILKTGEETVASMSDTFYLGKQNVWRQSVLKDAKTIK